MRSIFFGNERQTHWPCHKHTDPGFRHVAHFDLNHIQLRPTFSDSPQSQHAKINESLHEPKAWKLSEFFPSREKEQWWLKNYPPERPSVTWFKPKWGTYTIFLNTGLYFRSQGQIWPCTLLPLALSPFPWECPTTIPIHGLASITASRMRPWPRVHLRGWRGSFLRRLLAPFYFGVPRLFPTRRVLIALSSSPLRPRCLAVSLLLTKHPSRC